MIFFYILFEIFISEIVSYFSGGFDTSGYILQLLVPEISPGDGFCDGRGGEERTRRNWVF